MHRRRLVSVLFILTALLTPLGASAHEVYVLSPQTITQDLAADSPNPLGAFFDNQMLFFFWGFIAFVLVSTVFFASITRRLERFFEPYLTPLRRWAPLVARLTLGACLIASAYHSALFGPELPLSDFGSYGVFMQWVFYIAGAFIIIGWQARPAAIAAALVFLGGVLQYGLYMLNYTNYLGEMAVVFLLGGAWLVRPSTSLRAESLAFLLLRIAFGVSVAFAALYGKFWHSALALSTISQYHLTAYFQFDPLFIVLGAGIIEVLMGLFFIVGFEVRHTALFFLFWLALSLLYFGEAVWPHLILVGVNVALFMYGYDKWTIEGRLFNRGKLQPFL